MTTRRLDVVQVGDVTVVRVLDRKLLHEANINEVGRELSRLVESDGAERLLLDFGRVDFLSSAALGQLIVLDKKLKTRGGRLRLCGIRPEIREVFLLTRLDRVFDIHEDESSALAAFAAAAPDAAIPPA